jgi:hypothetical protein
MSSLPVRRSSPGVEELEDRVVPTLLGQQLFPADYPWNQNIANAPVAANSANVIAHIGGSIGIHPDWGEDSAANGSDPLYGIPYNVVHGNSTAKINVIIDNYPGESDIVPVPIPAGAVIEGDYQNGPNPNGGGYATNSQRGDSHLIVWDEDNNIAYELYGVTRPSDPLLFPDTNGDELKHTDGKWHAAQESVWDMSKDSFRPLGNTSADAAGLSILAGLVRPDEGLPTAAGGQGAIDHALRLTLPSGDVNPQYIYPASHVVSDSSGSTKLPFGARLRLMNTQAVNTIIDSLGPQAQIIAHAMQQYGLVLADIGSSMYVTGTSSSQDANNNIQLTWNMDDVLGLHALTASDFQLVDLSPVVTGLGTSAGKSGTTITVVGQNFSGAAGHQSVLFNGTPSQSVTFVDDSHLSVVVPGGSGTVDVQVQSGVPETDPNNPSDNVNDPIFGYGTSAKSPADLFTYNNQPISGTNSSDNFAFSSDTSGATDTLTIVVEDSSGNVVSGLASSAFGFSLSGGTSAGIFGPVSETSTPGKYTTSFTGTTAGSATTLTTTVAGVTLNSTPTVQVSVGSISGTTSTAYFTSPTDASGATDTLTILVDDAAGNAISGLADSAFSLNLSGGASGGTFGSVSETPTPGTYSANFTGTTAGTAAAVTVTVNGIVLASKPTVVVSPGTVSGANSTVNFAASTVPAGGSATVTLVLQDAAGNAVTGLDGSTFEFSLSGGTSAGTLGSLTETSTPGTYSATFKGTTSGSASTLSVTVAGVALTTTPTVQVTAGPVSGNKSSAGFATSTNPSGTADTLTIVVADAAGNAVTGLDPSVFNFVLAGGTSTGSFGPVSETSTPGTYTADFTGVKAGTARTVTVAVNGVTLGTKLTVRVVAGAASGDNSSAQFLYATIRSGTIDALGIVLRDAAGNVISGLGSSAFGFALSGGTSAGTFGTVTETTIKGRYRVAFTGRTAGTASTLTVTVNGVALTTTPTIRVMHGPVSGAVSSVHFGAPMVASGTTDAITITVADRASNAISGLSASAFRFVLWAGTSTGTFGAVTETSTPGTYVVAFTGFRAGTASTLTATVNGVVFAVKPTIQVTAGAVSAGKSYAGLAASTVASGRTDTLGIYVKDAAGNLVGGLDASAFGFAMSGGTSDGTFGEVTETAMKGKYMVVFTATTAGTASVLTVTVKGVTLAVRPVIRVTAG